jgi:hypothetical protein
MADVTERFAEQAANTLLQIGNVAQANFVTMNKVLDYDYLEGKNMVSLTEALGAREVASKEVPAGPNTVAARTAA